MEGRPTLTFTKATPFTDEDRKVLSVLSRVHTQGTVAPPFVIKHMLMHGIVLSQSTQQLN